jgi:hypothetical protein
MQYYYFTKTEEILVGPLKIDTSPLQIYTITTEIPSVSVMRKYHY